MGVWVGLAENGSLVLGKQEMLQNSATFQLLTVMPEVNLFLESDDVTHTACLRHTPICGGSGLLQALEESLQFFGQHVFLSALHCQLGLQSLHLPIQTLKTKQRL